jgi:5,6,7,8-tetrahydromethanopterin hydro-lyase
VSDSGDFPTQIGEGFAGAGPHAAHLASPSAGHTPFVCVLRPNLPVKPLTLFVPKATIAGEVHGRLTWGAAQAGVASGVAEAVASLVVPGTRADSLLLIAAVWVDPAASDDEEIFASNRSATVAALRAGQTGAPSVGEVLAERDRPWNPFFRAP